MGELLKSLVASWDRFAKLAAIVSFLIGLVPTLAAMLEKRSLDSKKDKLLVRLQALQILRSGTTQDDLINAQFDSALAQLKAISQGLAERLTVAPELQPLQRVLLWYMPPTKRAWIPHVLTWLLTPVVLLVFISIWIEGFDREILIGWLFFVGIFLLTRLWGASELRRYFTEKGASAVPPRQLRFSPLLVGLYAVFAITSLVGSIVLVRSDSEASARLAALGIILFGCAAALRMWSKALSDDHLRMPIHRCLLLLLPPALLTLIFLFDSNGIFQQEFKGDPIGYWRNWGNEPFIPILFIPLVGVPLYAAFYCLKRTRLP
jgi:hypothetical protein